MDVNFNEAKLFVETFETSVLGRFLAIQVDLMEAGRRAEAPAIETPLDPDFSPKKAESYLSLSWRTIKLHSTRLGIEIRGEGKGQRITLSGLERIKKDREKDG